MEPEIVARLKAEREITNERLKGSVEMACTIEMVKDKGSEDGRLWAEHAHYSDLSEVARYRQASQLLECSALHIGGELDLDSVPVTLLIYYLEAFLEEVKGFFDEFEVHMGEIATGLS